MKPLNPISANVSATIGFLPFGMPMPGRSYTSENYRFGFNGMEKDDEMKGSGNSLDFGARIYDSRLGRWLSLDLLQKKYPSASPFNFSLNTPIQARDPDGKWVYFLNQSDANLIRDDLNSIYKEKYGVETAFKVEKMEVQVKVPNPEYGLLDMINPFSKTEKYIIQTEDRYYVRTLNENFNFDTDKYTKATFDILNTNRNIEGVILPSNTNVAKHPLKFTISQAKGQAFSPKKFFLSSDLGKHSKGERGWTFGGTFLHETNAHYHFLGSKENNVPMQDFYGFPRSTMDHNGSPIMNWSGDEIDRLDKLRSKTGVNNKTDDN